MQKLLTFFQQKKNINVYAIFQDKKKKKKKKKKMLIHDKDYFVLVLIYCTKIC